MTECVVQNTTWGFNCRIPCLSHLLSWVLLSNSSARSCKHKTFLITTEAFNSPHSIAKHLRTLICIAQPWLMRIRSRTKSWGNPSKPTCTWIINVFWPGTGYRTWNIIWSITGLSVALLIMWYNPVLLVFKTIQQWSKQSSSIPHINFSIYTIQLYSGEKAESSEMLWFDAFLSGNNHLLALEVYMTDINEFPIKFKAQLSQLIRWSKIMPWKVFETMQSKLNLSNRQPKTGVIMVC